MEGNPPQARVTCVTEPDQSSNNKSTTEKMEHNNSGNEDKDNLKGKNEERAISQNDERSKSSSTSSVKELPDMVPVSVRHSLPEFQHVNIQNVLAGLLLTWEEFFHLFDVRLDPNVYLIRGTNGSKIDINDQISTYTGSFRRKQKMYTVVLSRITQSNEAPTSNPNLAFNANQSKGISGGTNAASSRYPTKRMKLLDEAKERSNHMETIAQSVVMPNPHLSNIKRPQAPRKDLKRGSVGSRTESSVADRTGAELNTSGMIVHDDGLGPSDTTSRGQRFSIDSRPSVRETTGKGKGRRGRKPKPKQTQNQESVIIPETGPGPSTVSTSVRNSRSTKESESDSSFETSDSDDDEATLREKRKRLKRYVIKYMREKVSPRTFLRIRAELMTLREQEKYFKVTSLVPLTAGMMEQTFCRNVKD